MKSELSRLPAVHRVLADTGLHEAIVRYGRRTVRETVRATLARARERIAAGTPVPDHREIVAASLERLAREAAPAYPEVINATGVVVHTNLGRAPQLAAGGSPYRSLEFDLDTGGRGERLAPVIDRLRRYFDVEAATVTTNNAAAVFLLLASHAAGRDVIVSRGELIEIGGSFRLPELMRAAGVRLVEVGCTNRTQVTDYEAAVGADTAAILVVHRSNFHMQGFVASPSLSSLVELARRCNLPLWVDQGSGCHLPLERYGLRHEATVQEILAAGADAVLFSGDKLLGGPQAGLVVGSEPAVAPLRRHPLRRALRPDKTTLRSLASTLDSYLAGRADEIPLYRLLVMPESARRRRAATLVRRLRARGVMARAVACRGVIGGGTTPDQTFPSWAVELAGEGDLARRLRSGRPAVVARVERGSVLVDLAAVFPEQDAALASAISSRAPSL